MRRKRFQCPSEQIKARPLGARGGVALVVCSSKLTSDKAAFIQYYGARLEKLGDFTIEGNLYCRDVLARAEPDRYVFLDQLHNWENPRAHYETTGPEIVSDLPQVQAIAGSLGSGGTMNGVARFIKEHHPTVKIITAESASGTKIPGTGSFSDGDFVTPFIEQLRERNLVDSWQKVDLQRAQERTKSLAKQGFFCGIQTGAVMEAAVRAATEMKLRGSIGNLAAGYRTARSIRQDHTLMLKGSNILMEPDPRFRDCVFRDAGCRQNLLGTLHRISVECS